MEPLRVAHVGLYILLAVLAWRVARLRPPHRPLAAYVTWMVATDWLRLGIRRILDTAPRPLAGGPLVLLHVDDLFVLSWSFLFVACCLHYFVARSPWAAIGAWAASWAITLNAPIVSGEVLSWIFRLGSLGCMAASWACIVWGVLRARIEPGLAHLVLILYASSDVVLNLVPYARGSLAEWPLVRLLNVLLLVAGIAAHLIWLRGHRVAAKAA